jgi:cold shock CspA family protein
MKKFQAKPSGYSGPVKSWNGVKGFGFISSNQIQGDIMFLRTDLPPDTKEVRDKFLNGKSVTFNAASGPDGRARASNVQISAADGDLMAGEIKSFSEKHGYGFINSSNCVGDVRFGVSDMDPLKPGAMIKGELVLFKAEQMPDGKVKATKVMFQSSKIASRLKASPGMQGGGMQAMQAGGMQGGGMMGGGAQFGGMMGGFDQGMKRGAMAMGGGFGNFGKKQKSGPVPTMSTGNRMKGMIKSFNTGKGFGFLSAPGGPGDVFFMKSELPQQSQEDRNLSGQAVSFELTQTMDGKSRAASITLG